MANSVLEQLFGLLQGIKNDAGNLHRDLDEKDTREETRGDLAQLFKSFGEMRTIMSKLDESDIAKLKEEMRQLQKGEENIFEYNRDVSNILLEVQKRTEKHEAIKDKVIENLPDQQQTQNVGSLFDNWRSILTNVGGWIEQNASNKPGQR